MAKIRNPILFSQRFNIGPEDLEELGVLDPTLNVDTNLFIDPLLLSSSQHPEMRAAASRYRSHFEQLMELLQASTREDDPAWRAAKRLIVYNEIKGTCLGFGAGSIDGSGIGPKLGAQLLKTAKEIVDIGIKNPKLFPSLMLFEQDVGPDRISDLTTNVILPDLIAFNRRVISSLSLSTTLIPFSNISAELVANPTAEKLTPIIFVPTDVLGELPAAGDWHQVLAAARHNLEVREKFNKHLVEIWLAKTRNDKAKARAAIFSSKDSFDAFHAAVERVKGKPYDITKDPEGFVFWHSLIKRIAEEEPLKIAKPAELTPDSVAQIVEAILGHFKYLIEKKGIWKELWSGNKPRPEKAAQRLFFVVADAYCKANNLDVTPEADSGRGPVDFKFSSGYKIRILAEIKLSTNKKLVAGYERQLEAYKEAEEAIRGYYVILDVGQMGKKDDQLIEKKNKWEPRNGSVSVIEFIDGKRQLSASKL